MGIALVDHFQNVSPGGTEIEIIETFSWSGNYQKGTFVNTHNYAIIFYTVNGYSTSNGGILFHSCLFILPGSTRECILTGMDQTYTSSSGTTVSVYGAFNSDKKSITFKSSYQKYGGSSGSGSSGTGYADAAIGL